MIREFTKHINEKFIVKHITKPKGKNTVNQDRNEHIIKLYEKYKFQKRGKKMDLFDFREPKYDDKEIYNFIQANYYPDLAISRIADITKKPNKT